MQRRIQFLIISVLLASGLGGCERFNQWMRSVWEDEKKVPVTEPTYSGGEPTTAPATQPTTTPAVETTETARVTPRPEDNATSGRDEEPEDNGPRGEVVTKPVLQIDSQNILTVTQVLRPIRGQLEDIPSSTPREKFRSRAKTLIERQIWNEVAEAMVYSEATKNFTQDQKDQIDAEIEKQRREMITKAGGSETKLKNMLADRGTTLEEVMAAKRRQLIIDSYLRSKFIPSVSIPRKRLLEYYNENISQYRSPKRVAMQIIAAPFEEFLPADVSSPTEQQRWQARQEARKVINRAAEALNEGQSFTAVAKELSRGIRAEEGGKWPMMPKDSFRIQEVENAAFELKVGQVSQIIKTDEGYYIVKARKVDAGKGVEFSRIQPQIEEKLRMQEYAGKVDRYLGELVADYKDSGVAQSDRWKRFISYAVHTAEEKYR